MYVKMSADKQLLITIPTTLYRGETNADMITFLVPAMYEGKNVADCTVTMKYILPDGIGKSEVLDCKPEKYREFLQYVTSVNTNLTAQAGEIVFWLSAIDFADAVVFKSGEAVTVVHESRDISDYLSPDDLDQLDALDARVALLEASKADNIVFHGEDSTIQLVANGQPIGDRVRIAVEGSSACVVDARLSDDGHLILVFADGSEKDVGEVLDGVGAVYVPHVDERKVLTFTIEDAAGEIPDPVDLNPHDEWGPVDDSQVVTDYIWESL